MQLKELDPHLLVPNPWNSNKVDAKSFEKLKLSLKRHGAFKPITVRELEDGTLQILGGYHRNEAAKDLKWETVPVVILTGVEEDQAKEIGLIDNTRYGEDDKELLDKLMAEMDDLPALAAIMPDIETLSFDDLAEERTEATDSSDEDKEETNRTLKFRFDDLDKADEIEDILKTVIMDHDYKYKDAKANYADALYHLLVLGK